MARFTLCIRSRADVQYQLILDSLDIWFPITGLELATLNDGILGAIGYDELIILVLPRTHSPSLLQNFHLYHGTPRQLGEDRIKIELRYNCLYSHYAL